MTTLAIDRRTVLEGALAAALAGLAARFGLPAAAEAAELPPAFQATTLEEALKAAFGSTAIPASKDVVVKVAEVAENGATVPVEVTTTLTGAETVAILAAKNARPLAAVYTLPAGTEKYVSTRLKLAQTTDVIAIVKAGGQVHMAKKEVKVTISGC
jgi:sulfur-oxidizing protein SoxY